MSLSRCLLYNQGLLPYLEALEWQRSLMRDRIQNPNLDDVLILLEHPPVYTLGQGSARASTCLHFGTRS